MARHGGSTLKWRETPRASFQTFYSMKKFFAFSLSVFLGATAAICNAQTSAVPPPTPYSVVSRGPSVRVWQRTAYQVSPSGEVVPKTEQYTELGDGICYLKNSEWCDSAPQIEILPDGSACGTNAPCQVLFPIDIGEGVIQLISQEGLQIELAPAALCYDDGSNTVILAVTTNSVGSLLSSQQAIYSHAFSGINADILYTYGPGGRFEQDVVLHQRPPDPSSLGLNPQTTCLKMLTEFVTPSQPTITPVPVQTAAGQGTDENLEFDSIKMIPGKAFLLGTNQPGVKVTKQLIQVNGKQFLVESVPVSAVADGLSTLPPMASAKTPARGKLKNLLMALAPERRQGKKGKSRILISKAAPPTHGLDLDFVTVNGGLTNYTFRSDTTYYISGSGITLFGTNTFEGGTVVKYTNGASISILPEGTTEGLIWNSQVARPVVFTAKDDNLVGQPISGSTGNPAGYYANPALNLNLSTAPMQTVSYFRVAYAQQAFTLAGTHPPNFYNGQIVDCDNGFNADGMNPADVENILFANVQTNFNSLFSATFNVENCTFDSSAYLATIENSPYQSDLLTFTNCIFVNILNLTNSYGANINFALTATDNGFYDAPVFGSVTYTNNSYPFLMVGAGGYYLTTNCAFRAAGTTNIDPILLADLAQKTTWPPIVYSNAAILTNTVFSPDVPRDTNGSPDLGYQYDPIDIAFCDTTVPGFTNVTFTAGTAVAWFSPYVSATPGFGVGDPCGLWMTNDASVTFLGTVTSPCIFASYNCIQEGCNSNWMPGYLGGIANQGGTKDPNNPAVLDATFTHFDHLAYDVNHFRDGPSAQPLRFNLRHCELWGNDGGYNFLGTFTNCLIVGGFLQQTGDSQYAFETNSYRENLQNCTFHDGTLEFDHWESPPYWTERISDCSFDGIGITVPTNGLTCDYNAFVTNAPRLPVDGPHDVIVTNFDWESSWFGTFYVPTNSPVIEAGSPYANLVGLYHFTTVTNQIPDGTNIVTIGYHYVATDQYGNPLDSNGDGIPDYPEDLAGNGSGNWDATMFLNVIITDPRNGSTIP